MDPINDFHFTQPLKRSVSAGAAILVSMVVVRYSLPMVMATTEMTDRKGRMRMESQECAVEMSELMLATRKFSRETMKSMAVLEKAWRIQEKTQSIQVVKLTAMMADGDGGGGAVESQSTPMGQCAVERVRVTVEEEGETAVLSGNVVDVGIGLLRTLREKGGGRR
ncbi:hypothetical protein AHAS_Ahas10G0031200 [Arachis hypogaea]